jgi:hypothetical protein
MKKTVYLSLLAASGFFASCKEKDVLINFGLKEGVTDSTYVGSTETPQNRNVLVEEFTGASCTNCPAGHEVVKALIEANPDRIVALAYHTNNAGGIFEPIDKKGIKSLYDFRDADATSIGQVIYEGLQVIPIAGIDRIKVGTSMLVSRPQWANEANKRLVIKPSVNMYMTSLYKEDEKKVNVKVKVVYNNDISTKNSISLGVVESNIIDAQEFPDRIEVNYQHNHIFRKSLTPYNGYPVLDSIATKKAGRVYEFNYVFTPDEKWNLDNCYLVAYINNSESGNKEVLQAIEVKLK